MGGIAERSKFTQRNDYSNEWVTLGVYPGDHTKPLSLIDPLLQHFGKK